MRVLFDFFINIARWACKREGKLAAQKQKAGRTDLLFKTKQP